MNDERWVGIPFLDGGRHFTGYDCWGLVKGFLEGQMTVTGLTDYGGTPAVELAAVARDIDAAKASPTWSRVDRRDAKRGDVVTMMGRERINGRPRNLECHVGVLVDPGHVLHVEEATDSVIVRLDHASIRHRLVEFYRHKDLM